MGVPAVEAPGVAGTSPRGGRAGQPRRASPSARSTVVAGSIGSDAPPGQLTWTSAFGSSGPADMIPRGRSW